MGMKYRPPSEKSVYYLHKDYYVAAVRYALQYKTWKGEIQTSADTVAGIRYDKEKVQTSNNYDSTSETAIRRAEIGEKIKMIDDIIAEVAPGLEEYLRMSVCYGFTYYQLIERGMPLNRNAYSVLRQHFYYELHRRI